MPRISLLYSIESFRNLLTIGGIVSVLISGGIVPARAAAPIVKTQAPGYYRIMLGDFEITALNDGVVGYQTIQLLPTATPAQIKAGLAESGLTD